MRKLIFSFLVGSVVFLHLSAQVNTRFESNGYWYHIINDTIDNGTGGQVLLSWRNQPGGSGNATTPAPTYDINLRKVVVCDSVSRPNCRAKYKVVGIEASAFFACGEIDSVLFPAGKSFFVGNHAFQYCKKLKEVVSYDPSGVNGNDNRDTTLYKGFSSSIDSIGIFAFSDCGFTKLDFAADTTKGHASQLDTIRGGTFSDCVALDSVIIGKQVKHIRSEAFANCKKLKFVRFDQFGQIDPSGQGAEIFGGTLLLDTLAFTKSDSIVHIHVRRKDVPILQESKSLKSIFKGINDTCVLYAPFRFFNNYKNENGISSQNWGQWEDIRPSYAVTITKKKEFLYPQRIDSVRYTLTHCGDSFSLVEKGRVTWSIDQAIASVTNRSLLSGDNVEDYVAEITTHSPGKAYIKGSLGGEYTLGEGVAPDSFLLTVKNVIDVTIKRMNGETSPISNNDTVFIHVNNRDTLKTSLRFYGTPNAEEVKDLLVEWKESHTMQAGDGTPYISRVVKEDTTFIYSSGHDTATYVVKVKNTDFSADSFSFTVISPRIEVTLSSTKDVDNNKIDSIDVYRATFLSVADTSRFTVGEEEDKKAPYPFVWKIVENKKDADGRPVADTSTVPSGIYKGKLRVKARRPGTFKIIALTATKDSVPSDTFTVVVKKPEISVKINAANKYKDHLQGSVPADKDTLTIPVNHIDTVYPIVTFFKKDIKEIQNIATAYNGNVNNPEWGDWDNKATEYIRELTRLDSLVTWTVKQIREGEDSLIRCSQYNDTDSALLKGLRHKGGNTEVIATYSFLNTAYRDTLNVIVPPIQAVIYDRYGDGVSWGNPLPNKEENPKRAYLNRKDTIGVYISYIGTPSSNAPAGTLHFSILGAGLKIDSVCWTSLDKDVALVNDSGIVTFIDTGAVQICVTTLWKSGDQYVKGVSDTVGFKVSVPEITLSWEPITSRLDNEGNKENPDTIRLSESDTVRVILTCDGLIADSLSAQLKAYVLDSTIVSIEKVKEEGEIKPAIFHITALAHGSDPNGKKTKVWLNDSFTVMGKKYAVQLCDSFWVCVPRIYVKIKDLQKRQLGRQYQLDVTISHDEDGHEGIKSPPESQWQSLTTATAMIVGINRDSVRFLTEGRADIRVETFYTAKVGNKESLVYGVADTLKQNVQKPVITVKINEVSGGRQTIVPQMTLNATVRWKDSGKEVDLFDIRWVSRNEKIFTVNKDNGEVVFVSNSVNGGEAYVVAEAFHESNPASIFAKDSLKIIVEAPVVQVSLGGAPTVKLRRSAEFKVNVTKNGAPTTEYDADLSWTVAPGTGEKTIEVCEWNASTHTLCVKGIAIGQSTFEARIEGKKIAEMIFDVPEPVIRVEKVSPSGIVFLGLHGGNSVLQACVFSDDMEVTGQDSLPLEWSISPSPPSIIQCTKSQNNNREVFIQALVVGEVTVTASTAGRQAVWEVVVPEPVITIKIPKKANGLEVKVDAEIVLPEPGVWDGEEEIDDCSIEWESRNQNVLEINGKKIKGKTVGSTWAVVIVTVAGVDKLDSIKVDVPAPDVEISLTSSGGTIPLNRGAVQQLPVTIKVDGVIKEYPVHWTSSSSDIVSVNGSGLLTATSMPGVTVETVTLTATLNSRWGNDGGPWQATASVNVLPSVIEVTPASLLLYIGETRPISGYSVTVDGMNPVELSGWTSGNTGVVTVNDNGALTAVGVGTTSISIPVLSEGTIPYVVAHVTVEDNAVVVVSLPTKLDTIPVHGTTLLGAKVTSNNVEVDTIPVTFELLTPELAEIASSTSTSVLLRGKSGGQVRVKATVRGGTIASNECIFVVRKPKVTVTATSHILGVKSSLSPGVIVEYSPEDIQTNIQLAGVRWSVSDTTILSVDTLTGFLQGRHAGTADLTARVPEGGISLPFNITVLPPVVSIRVQGSTQPVDSLAIRMSQTLSLEAAVVYNGMTDLNVSKVWAVSDPSIVEVSDFFGIMVGKLPGLTDVKVLTHDGGKDTVKVRVLPPSVTLTASPEKTMIGTGPKDTLLLIAVVGYDPDNYTPEVPVTWTVTPQGIVGVSDKGKVTPLGMGTAVIRAMTPAMYGGASASYTVIVNSQANALSLPSAKDFSARIKSDGLYLMSLAPRDIVEVYSPDGRIVLRAHAGDGFIPHTFSCGAYVIRAAGGICKVFFTH
ncbi:MAG: leucine-rich repeat domain-containing protein [Tannerellaceae bacterium]|jgi:hypothetical protein|nr:leucine-rich repeat domain-containing protein [Tannerellaceae bacterium]